VAILVDADEYVTQLYRYIHLNPERTGMVEGPGDYPWSSYRYSVGRKQLCDWLVTDFILGFFGQKRSVARKAYRQFVEALVKQDYESPLKDVFASTILGSLGFIKAIQEKYLVTVRKNGTYRR